MDHRRLVDAIADVIGDRTMTVCGERRTSYAEMALSTRRFASFLAGHGFGAHRQRDELANWECGQDRVALIMYNDQYPEPVLRQSRVVPEGLALDLPPEVLDDYLFNNANDFFFGQER